MANKNFFSNEGVQGIAGENILIFLPDKPLGIENFLVCRWKPEVSLNTGLIGYYMSIKVIPIKMVILYII